MRNVSEETITQLKAATWHQAYGTAIQYLGVTPEEARAAAADALKEFNKLILTQATETV